MTDTNKLEPNRTGFVDVEKGTRKIYWEYFAFELSITLKWIILDIISECFYSGCNRIHADGEVDK